MKKIIDIINITTGKLDSNAASENGQYPFFTCAPEPSKISSFAYDLDCILLTGNNASGNFKAFRYNGKFNAYQRVYIITLRDKNYSLDYIYYNILLNLGVLKKRAQGSQTKFLTLSEINNFEITELSLKEQEDIAVNLKIFDNHIKINNKIISELQELSKLIYNYWFVQFDFPNDEKKPYKSSGGKMVWNEELKREVPEDWEAATLQNNPYTRLLTPGVDTFEEKIYFATADIDLNGALSGSPIGYESRESRANMQPELNTIWFAKMKNSIKRLFFTKNSKTIDKYIISTGMFGLATTDNSFEYICSYVFNDSFEILKNRYSHGATQQSVNNEDLDLFPLVIPSTRVLEKYHNLVKDIWIMSENLNFENSELEKQRDFLLPLLMKGQVRIRDEE